MINFLKDCFWKLHWSVFFPDSETHFNELLTERSRSSIWECGQSNGKWTVLLRYRRSRKHSDCFTDLCTAGAGWGWSCMAAQEFLVAWVPWWHHMVDYPVLISWPCRPQLCSFLLFGFVLKGRKKFKVLLINNITSEHIMKRKCTTIFDCIKKQCPITVEKKTIGSSLPGSSRNNETFLHQVHMLSTISRIMNAHWKLCGNKGF